MINLNYAATGSQTIVFYPEVSSSYYNQASGSFFLDYVSDYDQDSGSIDLTLLNTPTSFNPRLVFSAPKVQVPEYTGQYTLTLEEALTDAAQWGTTNTQWSAASWQWSEQGVRTNRRVLDSERGWFVGTDEVTNTQYTSPQETGDYKVYHG